VAVTAAPTVGFPEIRSALKIGVASSS